MKTKIQTHLKSSALILGAVGIASTIQASGDYGPAIWRPTCEANWYTTGFGHKFHVVHDMEGYYAGVIASFTSCGYTRASVHYAVNGKQDAASDYSAGEITQMISESYYAWHALCWNQHSTGTEHEGFANNPAWYTEEQYQASAGVTRHIADKFGYAKDRNHIVGHGEKSNGAWVTWANANLGINASCNTHSDPGPYWDWSHYLNLVNGAQPPVYRNKVSDFNGNGKTEMALFRPASGQWWADSVINGTVFGQSGDISVPGDYNGDGKTDIAIFRPSSGQWFAANVPAVNGIVFGQAGDIPVPGDYNADG